VSHFQKPRSLWKIAAVVATLASHWSAGCSRGATGPQQGREIDGRPRAESANIANVATSAEGEGTRGSSPADAVAYPPWCSALKAEYAEELERLTFCRREGLLLFRLVQSHQHRC
jgi:hypothetical protein